MSKALEVLDYCIKEGKAKGADAIDGIMFESSSLSVRTRLKETETVERSESSDLGVRIMFHTNKGTKQAIVSSNDTSKKSLDRMIEQAVQMAKNAPEDPYIELAHHSQLAEKTADLEIYDAKEPAVEKLIENAKKAEEAALSIKGVVNSEGAEASYSHSKVSLATSHLFSRQYDSSSSSTSVSVIAGKDGQMETDYDYTSARFFSDLKKPEQIGHKAASRATAKLGSRKMQTCQVPVIFEYRVARDLISSFSSAINGAAIARKTSFLKDKMGEEIFKKGINIVDDPTRQRGLSSKPFDAEGIKGEKMHLIENGVLKTWILDLRSAKHLALKSNGRAVRGISSTPSPSTTNLYLENGKVSIHDLMGDIKNGFFITDAFGMGVNTVTGDYSQGASGFWIENGNLAYPVSEVTIAGNMLDMFKNLTPANDLDFTSSTNSPSVRIEGMTIAGS